MGDIYSKYLAWLCKLVDPNGYYTKLCALLHSITFRYSMEMDGNRYHDGISMRREFVYRKHLTGHSYGDFDVRPCSVLEMMVGLANRCEQQIMTNNEYGDRTANWFHYMLKSLSLDKLYDNQFDEQYARIMVDRFLDRQYDATGYGGLFYIPDAVQSGYDLRQMEIWDQAMLYLNTVLFPKGEID